MKIQFLGSVSCGFPIPSEEEYEKPLDFNELLITHKSSTFSFRASGDSMAPFILNNDIIVIDKSVRPSIGDLIIAEVNGCFVLKYLEKEKGIFYLKSENPKFENIYINEKLRVFGVVTGIVRKVKNEGVRASRLQ